MLPYPYQAIEAYVYNMHVVQVQKDVLHISRLHFCIYMCHSRMKLVVIMLSELLLI